MPKCLSFNRPGSISSALCWDKKISCVYKKIRQKLDKIRCDFGLTRAAVLRPGVQTKGTDTQFPQIGDPLGVSLWLRNICRFCHREKFVSRLSTEMGIFFVSTSEPSLQQPSNAKTVVMKINRLGWFLQGTAYSIVKFRINSSGEAAIRFFYFELQPTNQATDFLQVFIWFI